MCLLVFWTVPSTTLTRETKACGQKCLKLTSVHYSQVHLDVLLQMCCWSTVILSSQSHSEFTPDQSLTLVQRFLFCFVFIFDNSLCRLISDSCIQQRRSRAREKGNQKQSGWGSQAWISFCVFVFRLWMGVIWSVKFLLFSWSFCIKSGW